MAAALSSVAAAERPEWKTGPALRHQMQAVIGLSWPENPLRDSIGRLSEDQGVAMLLDRNVDPQTSVTLAERGSTLEQTIEHLAKSSGLNCCIVGPVVYFAPPSTAGGTVLAAVRDEEAGKLPPAMAVRLAKRQSVKWEMLAEPRALVEQAASAYGVRVIGLERIPHDLWPEADLPPLTLAERLTLLLAGFHLTFEWAPDGTAIRLIDVDDSASVTRVYGVPADVTQVLTELRRRFPTAGFERSSDGLQTTAKLAEHLAIERALRGAAPKAAVVAKPPPAGNATTYSLEIKNQPAGAVVTTVAKRQGWELSILPGAEAPLRELLTFKVENVSLDELMAKTLDPVGLGWRIEDGELLVFPKQ